MVKERLVKIVRFRRLDSLWATFFGYCMMFAAGDRENGLHFETNFVAKSQESYSSSINWLKASYAK